MLMNKSEGSYLFPFYNHVSLDLKAFYHGNMRSREYSKTCFGYGKNVYHGIITYIQMQIQVRAVSALL